MGGKPKRSTPADQRLKRNNPNAGKRIPSPNRQPSNTASNANNASNALCYDYTNPRFGSSNDATPRPRRKS